LNSAQNRLPGNDRRDPIGRQPTLCIGV